MEWRVSLSWQPKATCQPGAPTRSTADTNIAHCRSGTNERQDEWYCKRHKSNKTPEEEVHGFSHCFHAKAGITLRFQPNNRLSLHRQRDGPSYQATRRL